MKKSLMAILAVFSAMALQATEDSFLYWMIDPDAKIVGNGGVTTPVSGGTYYARVGYTETPMSVEQVISAGKLDSYLNLYATVDGQNPDPIFDNQMLGGSNIRTDTPAGGPLGAQSAPVYAGLTAAMTAANYTYWIELLNADNAVAGYGSIGLYETLAEYVSSMQGMATPSMAIAVGTFNAPEPSSGLLMLIGCAALALRRRKQIAA